MYSNKITNLLSPDNPHEDATKSQIKILEKILNWYIPTIKSFSESVGSKSGFVVTFSSHKGFRYRAENVFNNYYARGRGLNGKWTTNGETTNFWIQVKCPELEYRAFD